MHISPDDKRLQYCGRIDFDNPKTPVLVYAASFVQIRFTGTQISVTLENKRAYWSSRMGYIEAGAVLTHLGSGGRNVCDCQGS